MLQSYIYIFFLDNPAVIVQILVAIEHVYSLNIPHRDLKPQNIVLNKKKSVIKMGFLKSYQARSPPLRWLVLRSDWSEDYPNHAPYR